MPVITFSESDKLQGKVMEKGIYPMEVTSISEATASSSQKSITYYVTFRVIEGPFLNKEVSIAFNSKTNGSSLLGTMQYMPARDIMKVASAALNMPYESVPLNLDTDTIKNKPFDAIVDVQTSEGNLVNQINGFVPKGTGAAGPTW